MIIKIITNNDNSNNYDNNNNNNRTSGAVFKVRGPVNTSFEVEEGWGEGGSLGANLAVLSLWLFRTVRLLNLSLVIVERSHVYKF